MVRKTYDAPYAIISGLTVRVGGVPRRINFYPISIYAGGTGRGSRFVTSDESLQKALEECPLFNRRFFIQKEETLDNTTEQIVEQKKEEEKPQEVIVEKNENLIHVPVSTPADAREYLHENYGVELKSVWRKADLVAKAKELNILFEGI